METADSLDALISMVGGAGHVKEEEYIGGFQNLEEAEEQEEFSGGGGQMPAGKKRRLSVQQVRSLEQNFEVENKLEPERKMQLARELGLQPRQVAVWFQNRRARWKTKQLERDYGVLKLNYNALKSNFDAMQRDNQKLEAELTSLKKKLEVTGKRKADVLLKNEDKENRSNIIMDSKPLSREAEAFSKQENGVLESKGIIVFNEKLEGSESDSSAILNDHATLAPGNNSPRPIDSYICTISSLKYSTTHLQEEASRDNDNNYNNNSSGEGLMEALCCTRSGNNNNNIVPAKAAAYNHQHCIRMEDNEESCHFFNVEDPSAATLPWWEWS